MSFPKGTLGGISSLPIFKNGASAAEKQTRDESRLVEESRLVSVKVNIHPFLLHITNDQEVVEVSGSTVGECLKDLVSKFPDLREWLFEKDGKISNLVEIYVNMESSYPDELAKPVKDGDELQIVIIITGG